MGTVWKAGSELIKTKIMLKVLVEEAQLAQRKHSGAQETTSLGTEVLQTLGWLLLGKYQHSGSGEHLL